MKRLGALALAGFLGLGVATANATPYNANGITGKVEVGAKYLKFNSDENELDDVYDVWLKGKVEFGNGFYGIAKILYERLNYQDWVKNPEVGGTDFNVYIPIVRLGKVWENGLDTSIGFLYINADEDTLTADGSWGINLDINGQIMPGIRLGLFNSYLKVDNDDVDVKADITQFEPYIAFNYQTFYGRLWVDYQNINAYDEDDSDTYFRGGAELGYRFSDALTIYAKGQIGEAALLVEDRGEYIRPIARKNNGKAEIGLKWKYGQFSINPYLAYESWDTIDYKKSEEADDIETDSQSGYGVGLTLSYNF
jgi:hypothetical protein